jgi:peptide-methionine (R)-S-oxide reductase
MNRRGVLGALAGLSVAGVAACGRAASEPGRFEITRSDAEWQQRLTPEQFRVLRGHGTERAGSSPLDREKRRGVFHCAGCDLPLFASQAKFDSGTGWPSFTSPLPRAVGTRADRSLFMTRTEVHCRRCGGHLGHVFDDGPRPTGLRYCMNGAALTFVPG